MYSEVDHNSSDEVASYNSVAKGEESSNSLEALSDELGSFHISAPNTYTTNATTMDTRSKKQFKDYQVNDNFADSVFISQLHDKDVEAQNSTINYSSSPSSLSINENNSNESLMDYGTVHQRIKESTRGTTVDDAPAQFLPYMKSHLMKTTIDNNIHGLNFSNNNDNTNNNDSVDLTTDGNDKMMGNRLRVPESALIIRDIGDLSGQVLNTFKKKNDLQQSRIYNSRNESKSNDNLTTYAEESGNLSDEDDDDDPALEAKQVYNNLLKTQGSKFNMKRNITNTTSKGTTGPNELNLITPGSIGYGFKHSKGIWVPENEFQDISTSQLIENTTSNISKFNQSSTKNITSTFTIDENDTTNNRENIEDVDIGNITTPIDSPKIDSRRLLDKILTEKNLSAEEEEEEEDDDSLKITQSDFKTNHDRESNDGDVTRLSDIPEISFTENKQFLLSLLIDTIDKERSHKTTNTINNNWDKVLELNIKNESNLKNIIGLNEYMPNLIKINLSNNKISNITDISISCKEIDLSFNEIRNAFCLFNENNRIEILNLSHNQLTTNLNMLENCHNLKNINLSYNQITSMDGLGGSMIDTLNLSYNKISGIIDFNKIVQNNENNFGGWLSIKKLNLSNNNITEIKNIDKLINLKKLIINNNPIEKFKEINKKNNKLEFLEMTNDSSIIIRSIRQEINLNNLVGLKELRINGYCSDIQLPIQSLEVIKIINGTKHDIFNIIGKLPRNLKSLTINNIKDLEYLPIDDDFFKQLTNLNLKNNSIKSCYQLIKFLPYRMLLSLDISNNPILTRKLQHGNRHSNNEDFKIKLSQLLKIKCRNLTVLQL